METPAPASPNTAESEVRPSDYRAEIVVAAGSVTTLVALAAVFAAARHGENIMGWYVNYIIPAGALIVGMIAASGYGIAAWITGLKMTRRLMWSVVGQLAVSYFVAEYEQFRLMVPDGAALGFWAWFDETSRGFAWKQHDGGMGEPLGALGYGLRALEIGGFVLGGLMVPAILRAKPYCDPCRTYKRTRLVAMVPAGLTPRTFGKRPAEEYAEAQRAGLEASSAILAAAAAADRARLTDEIALRGSLAQRRATGKLTGRITVYLVRCPRCADGALKTALVQGQGNQIRTTRLGELALPKETVRHLFD